MSKLKLIVDMDECICDLSDSIRKNVNRDYGTTHQKGFNKSYWWKDYDIQQKYFEYLLNKKGLFIELEPIEGAIKILTKLYDEGYDIHILTCPVKNENCFYEKVEWVKNYLPFIDVESNFHATGNKGMFAKEDRILIDDNVKYLEQWSSNGGITIAFGQYGWNEDYDGVNAIDWNDAYKYIKQLDELNNTYNYDNGIDVDKLRNYMEREGC